MNSPPESGGVARSAGVVPKRQSGKLAPLELPLAGSASRSRCPPDPGGQVSL